MTEPTYAVLKFMDGRRSPCEILEPVGLFKHKWTDPFGVQWVGKRKKILVRYAGSDGQTHTRRVVESRIKKNNDGSYVTL